MNTYGGGWTLVWSYSFTNYAHLNDGSNAITPETTRQTGPHQEQHQQLAGVSSRTWQPGFWREGDINCSIIKHVTGPSHELVPSRFSPNQSNSNGPLLCMTKRYNSTNYYFDGRRENHRPTHDPLGGNSPKQKKNVANPHGTFSFESSRKERL